MKLAIITKRLEIFFLILFILALPLQLRHIFYTLSNVPPLYENTEYLLISLYASSIFLFLSFVSRLFHTFLTPKTHYIKSKLRAYPLLIPPILYLLYIIGRNIFIPRDTFSTFSMFYMVGVLIFTLYIGYVSRDSSIRNAILKSLVFSGVIQAFIATLQFLHQRSLGIWILHESPLSPTSPGVAKILFNGETLIRSYGMFFHPNQLAAFLVVACATCIYLYIQSKSLRERFLYSTAYLISTTGLILSFSRAGIVALAIFAPLFFLFLMKQKVLNWKKSFLMFAAIYLLLLIIFSPLLLSRATLSDKAVTERLNYNSHGIKLARGNILFGVGSGNLIPELYPSRDGLATWQMQPPHNYYIVVACEAGLVGLIFLLLTFVNGLRMVMRKEGEEESASYAKMLFSLLATFYLMMFIDHYFYTLHQTVLLFWLVYGLAIGVYLENRK